MKTKCYALLLMIVFSSAVFNVVAQEDTTYSEEAALEELAAFYAMVDSIENSLNYQTGDISILDGQAVIHVPEGFRFLDANDAQIVLTQLWGNPESETMGMLVPDGGVMDEDTYAYNIFWEGMGYVEDDDAEDTDYDELLEEMKKDAIEESQYRRQQGYSGYEVVGWASEPYYDSNRKVLHWAKALHFDDEEVNTLNYNVRVLGRKGVMTLNAIGTTDQLELVKKDIDKVLSSVQYTEGNRYADFDSSIDEVAAYTIGGLVAGKILAKVGIFAGLAKFGKFIILGIVAAFAAVRKFIFGKKKESEEAMTYNKEG
ncbi:MAG: DUF2167 domain-containing protein [Flavobacteriales bacterium]